MTIKAIETVYKGYRFRSRLEARWAVFFDTLGIEWQYELEGFDLGESGWYLPDFFLPQSSWFVEVKPSNHISEEDQAKINALDDNPPNYAMGVLVACGEPDFAKDVFDQKYIFLMAIMPDWIFQLSPTEAQSKFTVAVNAARQARFEHGQNGH